MIGSLWQYAVALYFRPAVHVLRTFWRETHLKVQVRMQHVLNKLSQHPDHDLADVAWLVDHRLVIGFIVYISHLLSWQVFSLASAVNTSDSFSFILFSHTAGQSFAYLNFFPLLNFIFIPAAGQFRHISFESQCVLYLSLRHLCLAF